MADKVKRICRFVLFFIYSNVIYGLIVFFVFTWLSKYSLLLGYLGNLVLIILGLMLDAYLHRLLQSNKLVQEIKKEKNPEKGYHFIQLVLDNYVSFKTSLYLFYLIVLIFSQIIVFYPTLFGENISNFIQANNYSILFLIALDMLVNQFSNDRNKLKTIGEKLKKSMENVEGGSDSVHPTKSDED